MMMLLNTWWFNVIGYLFFVVIFYQFYKLSLKNVENDGAATILLQFIGGISIMALSPFLPFVWPSDAKTWIFLITACIFYALDEANGSGTMKLAATLGKEITVIHGKGSVIRVRPSPSGFAELGGLAIIDKNVEIKY